MPALFAAKTHKERLVIKGPLFETNRVLSSFCKSFVPITNPSTLLEARLISEAFKIPSGVSIIAQILVLKAATEPIESKCSITLRISFFESTLGTKIASQFESATIFKSSSHQSVLRPFIRTINDLLP